MKIISGLLGFVLFSGSAFAQIHIGGASEVQQRFNIDIPTKDITVAEVSTLIDAFSAFIVEGHTEVSFAEVAGAITIPGKLDATVKLLIASRDPNAQVDCIGRKCVITSLGQKTNFKVDGVNLPVIGTPSIFVEKKIEIFAEVSDDKQKVEICRINGVAVKAGFLKPTVDGALIELDGDTVKTLRIDAGVGGDYPNDNCRWAPGSVPNVASEN